MRIADVDDRVWYDDNPGIVKSVNLGSALVDWDSGARSIVALSDLVLMTDRDANTAFRTSTERLITWDQVPAWVRPAETDPSQSPQLRALMKVLWTTSTVNDNVLYAYWPDGTFMAQWERKHNVTLPKDVDPTSVVTWYDLPTWIKGSYRTDAEMRHLQALTWVKGSESTYFGYEANGRYAGMWERE